MGGRVKRENVAVFAFWHITYNRQLTGDYTDLRTSNSERELAKRIIAPRWDDDLCVLLTGRREGGGSRSGPKFATLEETRQTKKKTATQDEWRIVIGVVVEAAKTA